MEKEEKEGEGVEERILMVIYSKQAIEKVFSPYFFNTLSQRHDQHW